jgi:hypothetical protein
MAMNGDVPWKDLETRGFVHIPGFLSPDELAAVRADYADQPVDPGNRNYALSKATERGVGPIRHRVEEVLTAVRGNTALDVDQVLGGTYFATRRGISFNWHQDHESYFEFQNHIDYLNFYFAVFKPVKNKSNLCVLPFDELERRTPETFRRTRGGGAASTYDLGGRQLVLQDQEAVTHLADVDLETLTATPQLEAGDLLLMRGDIFHRTEDNDTDRVALSIRAVCTRTIIRRAHLADGGLVKARRMSKHEAYYATFFRAFDVAGRDEMPLADFLAAEREAAAHPPAGAVAFRSLLLREKIRSGVLLSFVRKALSETVLRPMVRAYHRRRLQRARGAEAPATAARTT